MASINNPDIIILGGLDDLGQTEPDPEPAAPVIDEEKIKNFGLGAVVGVVLGAIVTYIAVKRG